MKNTYRLLLIACCLSPMVYGQNQVTVTVEPASDQTISADIYGHFSEHLGRCIYDGIWVGPDSDIPNKDGYRLDVLEALRELHIPVLRWPGGCFADDYHWQDGIGPQENRTLISNNHWGGTMEDNSFGTHEFLDYCELVGTKPYVSGNIGSGTPEELAKWVEYMTSNSQSTVVNQRRANGRDEAWDVRYLGIGNEAWGCGGNMTADYYSDLFRRYSTYTRNYNGHLYKVACGGIVGDFAWTETVMRKVGTMMDGYSLHYYTIPNNWDHKGSATEFDENEYYVTLAKALNIEDFIARTIEIMEKYDTARHIDLIIDEWGTWYDVEPGTNPGHLYQQATMRDALVAALSFDIFHRYSYCITMANIAQTVNVLQSMILTDGPRMILTPTYHVFNLFKVHQNATWLPTTIENNTYTSVADGRVPTIAATASVKDGKTHVALINTDLKKSQSVILKGANGKVVSAQVLSAKDVHTTNTFDKPHEVEPKAFTNYKKQTLNTKQQTLSVTLPPCSIVTLEFF